MIKSKRAKKSVAKQVRSRAKHRVQSPQKVSSNVVGTVSGARRVSRSKIRSRHKWRTSKYSVHSKSTRRNSAMSSVRNIRNTLGYMKYSPSMRLKNKKIISRGLKNFNHLLKEFKSQPWSHMSKTTHMQLNKPVFMSKHSLNMVDFQNLFENKKREILQNNHIYLADIIVYQKYSKMTDAITDAVSIIFLVDQNDKLHVVTNIDDELIDEIKLINSRSRKRFLFIYINLYVYIHPKSEHFDPYLLKDMPQPLDQNDIPDDLFDDFDEALDYVKDKKTVFPHANALLLDREKKTVEYFEPNGQGFLPYNVVGNENIFYDSIFSQIIPDYDSYTFIPTLDFCPYISFHGIMDQKFSYPQYTRWGFCLIWNMYCIEMRLLNPNLTQKDLVFYMLKEFTIPGSMTTELTSAYTLLTIMAYTIAISYYADYKNKVPPVKVRSVRGDKYNSSQIKKVKIETVKKIFGTTKKSIKVDIYDLHPERKVLKLVDYFHHIPNLPADFQELLNYITELCQKK